MPSSENHRDTAATPTETIKLAQRDWSSRKNPTFPSITICRAAPLGEGWQERRGIHHGLRDTGTGCSVLGVEGRGLARDEPGKDETAQRSSWRTGGNRRATDGMMAAGPTGQGHG